MKSLFPVQEGVTSSSNSATFFYWKLHLNKSAPLWLTFMKPILCKTVSEGKLKGILQPVFSAWPARTHKSPCLHESRMQAHAG